MSRPQLLTAALILFAVLTVGPALRSAMRVNGAGLFSADSRLGALRLGLLQAVSGLSLWALMGVCAAAYAFGLAAIWIALGVLLGAAWSGAIMGPGLHAMIAGGRRRSTLALLVDPEFTALPPSARPRSAEGIDSRPRSAALIVLLTLLIALGVQFHIGGHEIARALDAPAWVGVLALAALSMLPVVLTGRAGVANAALAAAPIVAATALILPAVALAFLGGTGELHSAHQWLEPELTTLLGNRTAGAAALLILGGLGMGLGLLGQVHVHDHVAAARGPRSVRRATLVTLTWYALVLSGMLLFGWSARVLYTSVGDAERTLLDATERLLPPEMAVMPLIAIVAAITISAGSQLLTLAEIGLLFSPTQGTEPGEQIRANRVRTFIVVATGIAAVTASLIDSGTTRLFLFAWLVPAVACGPLLLLRVRGVRIRPLVAALALRLGVIATLVLFVLRTETAYFLVMFVPFLAVYLVAWSGRIPPERPSS